MCPLVYPRGRLRPPTSSRSTTPSAIRRMARPTTSARVSHSGDPGAISGRHRRHARKPAACAPAAVGKNSTFDRLGMVAGQLGRQ
jgi:hypothetical protein